MINHSFRAPKVKDDREWLKIALLVEHGFYFQKSYEHGRNNGELQAYPNTSEEVAGFAARFDSQTYEPTDPLQVGALGKGT